MSNKSRNKYVLILVIIPVLIIGFLLYRGLNKSPEVVPLPTSTPTISNVNKVNKNSWGNIPSDQRRSWLKDKISKSKSSYTKAQAEKLLKNIDAEAVPLLLDLAHDKAYRHHIIYRLRILAKNQDVREVLYSELQSKDPQTVVLAMRSLLEDAPDERYINTVISLLKSSSPDVVGDALMLLQMPTMRSDKAVEALLEMFPVVQDPNCRLIMALGYQGSPNAIEPLISDYENILEDKGQKNTVRRAAIMQALGEIGGEQALQSILKIPVTKDHDLVLASAVEAIGRIVSSDASLIINDKPVIMETLISLLESGRSNVYGSANSVLSSISGQTVKLKYNATREEAQAAASRWRKIISNINSNSNK